MFSWPKWHTAIVSMTFKAPSSKRSGQRARADSSMAAVWPATSPRDLADWSCLPPLPSFPCPCVTTARANAEKRFISCRAGSWSCHTGPVPDTSHKRLQEGYPRGVQKDITESHSRMITAKPPEQYSSAFGDMDVGLLEVPSTFIILFCFRFRVIIYWKCSANHIACASCFTF